MRIHRARRLCTLLLVCSVLQVQARLWADGPRPNCFVLAVGIDNYTKAAKLKGCVNDARNIVGQFQKQEGNLFGKVVSQTILDGEATTSNLTRRLEQFRGLGQPGDFAVLFLSGHGGRQGQSWFFLPYDHEPGNKSATQVGDRQILAVADALADRGNKVIVIIDACHAGQVRLAARDSLNRHRDSAKGGLVLMLSSMPAQTSAALGQYSAFAKAVGDALAGHADVDSDGYVTLREVRRYAYDRTHQLVRQSGIASEQDGECDWSFSISENLRLAHVPQRPPLVATNVAGSQWTGNEQLAGYGTLAFHFHADRKVIMTDAKGTSQGSWAQDKNTVTMRFFSDRVMYTGTLHGGTLSGNARSEKANWSWQVRLGGAP